MRIIAHRGNLTGRDHGNENSPDKIDYVLSCTPFDVEIDVWKTSEGWFLGHDDPYHKVEYDYLVNPRFWLHAKTGEAFSLLQADERMNVFFHSVERYVLTSKGQIWTYYGERLFSQSICVMPERDNGFVFGIYGVCTDFPYMMVERTGQSDLLRGYGKL